MKRAEFCSRTGREEQKGNENACQGGVKSSKATNAFSLNWRRWQACDGQKWKRKVTRRHIKHGVGCKCEAGKKKRTKKNMEAFQAVQ